MMGGATKNAPPTTPASPGASEKGQGDGVGPASSGPPRTQDDSSSTASPSHARPPWRVPDRLEAYLATMRRSSNVRRFIVASPLILFFLALYWQSCGQYYGTKSYVHWMDTLKWPQNTVSNRGQAGHPRQEHVSMVQAALVDRAFSPAEADEGNAMPTAVSLMTGVLQLAWLVWIAKKKDVRLWTHTLLAASCIASAKGFLAWATVVPDASGWSSCRQRLGDDGLSHYRQETDGFQVPFDIWWLELQGVASAGSAARGYYCTSGFISTPTYVATIFSLAIYDGVCAENSAIGHARGQSQYFLMSLSAILVALIFLATAVPVVCRHNYTADVLVSLFLSVLVYGNPAISLLAERWSQASKGNIGAILSLCCLGTPSGPSALANDLCGDLCRNTDMELSSIRVPMEDEDEYKALDVGQVLAVPFAPCWREPTLYLRSQPGRLARAPPDYNLDHLKKDQMAHFETIKDQQMKRQQKMETTLEAALETRRFQAAEAAKRRGWDHKSGLAKQNDRLEHEEKRIVEEAKRRLGAEQETAKRLQQKIEMEASRHSAREAYCRQERERLEAIIKQSHEETVIAAQACETCKREIEELQREASEAQELRAREAARRAVQGFLEIAQRNKEEIESQSGVTPGTPSEPQ